MPSRTFRSVVYSDTDSDYEIALLVIVARMDSLKDRGEMLKTVKAPKVTSATEGYYRCNT